MLHYGNDESQNSYDDDQFNHISPDVDADEVADVIFGVDYNDVELANANVLSG